MKWHVPFGSPLRSPLCAAGDTAFCAKSAATVKGMDLMYSTCMAVAEAAAFHGRHPMKSSVAIDVAAAMLDGKSAARRYPLSGALGGTSESACRAVAAPAPCYTKYNASFAQDAKTLVEEFRKLEKITPRIETDREKTESYKPSADRMVFRTYHAGNSAEWTTAYGTITSETPRDFEAFLWRHKSPPRSMNINSPGGNLFAGMKLGELIREHGFYTSVGGGPYKPVEEYSFGADSGGESVNEADVAAGCYSACAYAFLGGISRTVSKESSFGVHQFYSRNAIAEPTSKAFSQTDLSMQQVVTGLLVEYVLRMGVDARLISEATKSEHDTIRLLKADELDAYRVSYDPARFGPWQIIARGTSVVARANSHDGKQVAQIACFRSKAGVQRKFAFWIPSSNFTGWEQVVKNAALLDFAGMKISSDKIAVSSNGKNVIFSTDLPVDYEKRIAQMQENLKFAADMRDAPMYVVRSFDFPEIPREGLFNAATIALRNCLPAR
ncbi:MAG: hypothetical protein Q7T73_11300 [Beijerinckiaceae bacterium]|nr:hypothetical protein [Beijerinckiaceae bacterium]